MEDYHTHYLGKTNDGKLFFGSDTFAHKKTHWEVEPDSQNQNRIDLAILYLFDKNGKFLEYRYWSTDIDIDRHKTTNQLEKMVSELGQVTFCDIEVETFEINIDGTKCGLIRNEETESVDLYPSNTISFQKPWDGEYFT
jgi:formate hydrogenlyase regulatory protein HycA